MNDSSTVEGRAVPRMDGSSVRTPESMWCCDGALPGTTSGWPPTLSEAFGDGPTHMATDKVLHRKPSERCAAHSRRIVGSTLAEMWSERFNFGSTRTAETVQPVTAMTLTNNDALNFQVIYNVHQSERDTTTRSQKHRHDRIA